MRKTNFLLVNANYHKSKSNSHEFIRVNSKKIRVDSCSKKFFGTICVICFSLICVISVFAADETITLTTYYPAPYGVYDELKTSKFAVGKDTPMPGGDGQVNIAFTTTDGKDKGNTILQVGGYYPASTRNPVEEAAIYGYVDGADIPFTPEICFYTPALGLVCYPGSTITFPVTGTGVIGQSNKGTGVKGIGGSGIGVYGMASNVSVGDSWDPASPSSAGVYGTARTIGVFGKSGMIYSGGNEFNPEKPVAGIVGYAKSAPGIVALSEEGSGSLLETVTLGAMAVYAKNKSNIYGLGIYSEGKKLSGMFACEPYLAPNTGIRGQIMIVDSTYLDAAGDMDFADVNLTIGFSGHNIPPTGGNTGGFIQTENKNVGATKPPLYIQPLGGQVVIGPENDSFDDSFDNATEDLEVFGDFGLSSRIKFKKADAWTGDDAVIGLDVKDVNGNSVKDKRLLFYDYANSKGLMVINALEGATGQFGTVVDFGPTSGGNFEMRLQRTKHATADFAALLLYTTNNRYQLRVEDRLYDGFEIYENKPGTGSRFFIAATTGNVGIGGYTSPAYKLAVNGSLYVNGSAYKEGTLAWTAPSDARLKKNVKPMKSSLDKMLKLRGVNFEWIEPTKHANMTGVQMGMVAQDVEKVFPQWVGKDHEGYKTLTLVGFEALTVESVKELNQKISNLEAKNKQLEERIKKLEEKIKN